MILNEERDKVSSNLTQTQSFSIEANEAAFQILSDKLYKYPIRAIVRENASNAIDALRQIGKPLNDWELTIPNSVNPMFAIEDHGVGMNDEEINQIYTTFFKSTKSSSNDQTGMFGLGSKTPFSYTKQFIVESSKDGFKNIYSMHSENGMPEVSRVNPEPIPTDKTGTKVSFVVKNEDFREFYEAIIRSSAVWPGLPKLNGASEFFDYIKRKMYDSNVNAEQILKNTNEVYSKYEKLPEQKTKRFFELGNDKFALEMGNVLYYVSLEQLDIPYVFRNIDGSNFLIHAPIGAVSITPNREDLQYDEKTKKFLEKEIKSVIIKNYEFTMEDYNSSNFETLLNTEESEITSEAKKALKNLKKAYNEFAKKVKNIDKAFENRDMFVIKSFLLRNSSKNLTSAWRGLDGYFDFKEQGFRFLQHIASVEKPIIKMFELSDGEYKRYKLTDGMLTGFFNTRMNRINRDMFAEYNKKNKEIDRELTGYGNEPITTPIYIFCKPGTSEKIKSLYKDFENLEVIKEFSKLPSSFDYNKSAIEKVKEDMETKKCFYIQTQNGYEESISIAELKTKYAKTSLILMMKPGRSYEFIDFERYLNGKEALDKFAVGTASHRFPNLLKKHNSIFSTNYAILTGKPSDFKKLKMYELKDFDFIKFVGQKDYNDFEEKLSNEVSDFYLKELEKMPTKIKYQKVISKATLERIENNLGADSDFFKKVKNICDSTVNPKELDERRNLLNKASEFKYAASDSIRQRISKYENAQTSNCSDDILELFRKVPLGKSFINDNYYSYYSVDDCWRDMKKFDEFCEVVKLIEKSN